MPDFEAALTRKLGPLPVWAWGGVVGGSLLVVKAITGGGSSGASSSFVQPIAGGTPADSSGIDFGSVGGGGAADGSGDIGIVDPHDDAPEPWYAVIPGVGLIVDRAADAITVIRNPPIPIETPTVPTPSVPTVPVPTIPPQAAPADGGGIVAAIGRIFAPVGTKFTSAWMAPGGAYVKTRTATGVVGYIRPPAGKTFHSYWLAPDGSYVKTATGDTSGGTFDTPDHLGTYGHPVPLGNRLAVPAYRPTLTGYGGPTFDAITPIASRARIEIPELASPSGIQHPPRIVPATGGDRRALVPLRRVLDRWTADNVPTTRARRARALTAAIDRIEARLDRTG